MEETILGIYHCLVNAQHPLTKTNIANKTSLDIQLINYWIPKMIKCGLIIPCDRKKYEIQPVLKDKTIYTKIEPLIKQIASNIKYNYVENPEKAISSCLVYFLLDNITE